MITTVKFYGRKVCGTTRWFIDTKGLTPDQVAAIRVLMGSDRCKNSRFTLNLAKVAAWQQLGGSGEQVPAPGSAGPGT